MDNKINQDLLIKYIKKIATDSEKKQVEDWINASSVNKNQFDSFLNFWNNAKVDFTDFTPDINEGWEQINKETLQVLRSKQSYSIRTFIRIACPCLLYAEPLENSRSSRGRIWNQAFRS